MSTSLKITPVSQPFLIPVDLRRDGLVASAVMVDENHFFIFTQFGSVIRMWNDHGKWHAKYVENGR